MCIIFHVSQIEISYGISQMYCCFKVQSVTSEPMKTDLKNFLFELFVFVHCGAEIGSEKEGGEQCGSEDGNPVDV